MEQNVQRPLDCSRKEKVMEKIRKCFSSKPEKALEQGGLDWNGLVPWKISSLEVSAKTWRENSAGWGGSKKKKNISE